MRRCVRLPEATKDEIVAMYLSGYGCLGVGKKFDRCGETIKRVLKERGVKLRRPGEYQNGQKTGQPISSEVRERARTATEKWWAQAKERNPSKLRLYAVKQRARIRNLDFDLSEEDIVIPEFCPILGIKLQINKGKLGPKDNSPTVDRIDPRKGYVKGNIQVISDKANRIKSNATAEEVEKVLLYMKKVDGGDGRADEN